MTTLPAVALVGRPNVGKSTLFNRITRTRDALVANEPGVTRDRRYGVARAESGNFIVIDTGGVGGTAAATIEASVARQVDYALEEADSVVLVVDYRQGVTAGDERIAEKLRRAGKPVTIAVNKAEGVAADLAEAEFHRIGLGPPIGISAVHGEGVERLLENVLAPYELGEVAEDEAARPKVAVIGRPNVGKSTLINRFIGDDRLVTSPEPGTTRDAIVVPCERDGYAFMLIDTAGMRRRARVSETVEKFSVVQSLRAIEDAAVVIVLVDAREGITDQDLHLVGLAAERGRGLVIGVNKWDGLSVDKRRSVESEVDRMLDFVAYASIHYLSALHGSGISEVIQSAMRAYESAGRELPTARLNAVLARAVQQHAPPMIRGRQPRLRYAHQGGRFPPLIVVHGSQADRLPGDYRRYLENTFREALRLVGTPIKIELRSGENPFAGRRKTEGPRKARDRKRAARDRRKKPGRGARKKKR
jgi:GTP-binding protein